jgi:hypothetical protein
MPETGGALAGASSTLVSKHGGEIMQPAEEAFWRQRKVQRRAFLLFLVTLGLLVGARVTKGGDGGSGSGSGSDT